MCIWWRHAGTPKCQGLNTRIDWYSLENDAAWQQVGDCDNGRHRWRTAQRKNSTLWASGGLFLNCRSTSSPSMLESLEFSTSHPGDASSQASSRRHHSMKFLLIIQTLPSNKKSYGIRERKRNDYSRQRERINSLWADASQRGLKLASDLWPKGYLIQPSPWQSSGMHQPQKSLADRWPRLPRKNQQDRTNRYVHV